jgi:hypothetical protein
MKMIKKKPFTSSSNENKKPCLDFGTSFSRQTTASSSLTSSSFTITVNSSNLSNKKGSVAEKLK